jgi:hypothetical protein
MARQRRPPLETLSPMNKNALLAVVALLVVALGALWWTTFDNAPSATPGADVERAAGPASSPTLATDAVQPDGPAPLELAEEAATAVQDTRAAARPSREPVWLEVAAKLPAGVPNDEQAEIVVLHGAGLDDRESKNKPSELRSALDPSGRARIEIPAGVAELRVELRARYMYLDKELELRAPFERVELEPKLGAWLSATLVLPRPLPADVDLTQAAPFELEVRGFDVAAMGAGGGGHSVDRTLDSREHFEVGGLRPKLNYFLSVDPQVFVHVRDLELRAKAGEHLQREYVIELGARVRGTVRDAAGAPLTGVMVRSSGRNDWMNGGSRAATTDAQGAFDLRGLAAGKLRLSAQSASHLPKSSEEFEVQNGETARVDLQLESGGSLSGVVRFPDGSLAAGADVLCIDATGERGSGGFKALKADDQGRFEFKALDGKNYSLRATRSAARDPATSNDAEGYEWSRVQSDVPPGAAVELVLSPPHRVAGRVSDTSGKPVTTFALSHRWNDGPRNLMPSGELENPDGAFELWLGAGEHVVFASAKGYEMAAPDGVKVETPESAGPIEIGMRRQAAISGLVTRPDGAPAEGARVEVQGSRGRGSNRATTDEDGRFALDQVSAGVHKLVAKAEGFAPSEAASVEVTAGQALEGVNLVLRIGGRVEGVIYDASGAPEEGRTIVVGVMAGGMGDLAGQATSDSAGRFVLEHVTPGTHNVIATPRMSALRGEPNQAALMASLKMTSIEVLDGQTTQVVLGAPPAAPVKLSGRVTRGGEPLREGMVTAIADGGSLLESMKFAPLDKDGGYELVLDKPGAYTLLVGRRMGDSSAEFFENIPAAAEHRLDLELPSGGLRGRVVGPDGAPIAGIAVRHEREGVTSLSMFDMNRAATTDADGRFELGDLAPGLYTLRAGGGGGFAGGRSSWGVAVRPGVEVKDSATPTQVELVLETPGVIAGSVLDAEGRALPEASIFVRDAAGVLLNPFSSTRTDAQGKFRFESAAPGAYSVSARAPGAVSGESQSVRVTAGGVAEVELRTGPGTTLVLEIESGSGAVVRANVRVLDSAGRDHAGLMSFDSLQSLMSGGASAAKRRFGPLAPGKYKVIVTPPGGGPITKPVTLSGQAERNLKVRLED